MANIGFGEFDIPFIQNPFTNPNQGAIPILQKDWNGWGVPQQQPQQGQKSGGASEQSQAQPTSGAYSGGSSGSGSGKTVDQNVLGQYNTAINTTQSALDRLPNQFGIAQGNINSQYNTNRNELDTTKKNAKNSYNTSTTQNQQSYRTDKNQIADSASAGLGGLLRTLGAYGAGGSSDAMYVAPQAVATQASQERAGAGQNFAQNAQSLDTNWNNFLSEDENSRKKLEDWKSQQLNSAQAQSETTKQSLLSKLADLIGQKAAYEGGSYDGAAQPYINEANALSSSIDNLAKINPTYTGNTPVYEAPTLGSYTVDPNSQVTAQNAAEQSATPFLSLLMNNQKKNNGLAA